MNTILKRSIAVGLSVVMGLGLFFGTITPTKSNAELKASGRLEVTKPITKAFEFQVVPETFELTVSQGGQTETVSEPLPRQKVSNYQKTENAASWTYPDAELMVSIDKKPACLEVQVTSTAKGANEIAWPKVTGEQLVMPFGEGKMFSSADANWKTYLSDMELEISDGFSMQFFGVMKKQFGILYMVDDMYNTSVKFDTQKAIDMQYTHAFTKINKDKTYGYKIYVTDKDPVQMAKIYRQEQIENGKFTTLAEKAKKQPNIKKLYGAPHIYLWDDKASLTFLDSLKKEGIEQAWIGFDTWSKGVNNPKFVQKANKMGYLIGMYDSYHSIHAPGKAEWETAAFQDASLYEKATVTKQNGKKATGFNGRGRKLNPVFGMDEVKYRIGKMVTKDLPFNSWFIDCDATGEILDDYSPDHVTTVQQDIAARLARMAYIRDSKNLVIGSEGGNDFASQTIAFAHGIELPAFSWMDPDMNKNKQSPYYLGKYYAYKGGVPEVFAKQVPLKALYKEIFMNPFYDVPLFKLVYNDSVITTYQWGWSTLKIKDEVENRMLKEVLYNIPPLYHLDERQWRANKELIKAHHKQWRPFHEQAVQKEMTDFKCLNPERTVQMTVFGTDIAVIVNYSEKPFTYEGKVIDSKKCLILNNERK